MYLLLKEEILWPSFDVPKLSQNYLKILDFLIDLLIDDLLSISIHGQKVHDQLYMWSIFLANWA